MTGRYTVRYGMQYNAPINPGEPWGVPLSEKVPHVAPKSVHKQIPSENVATETLQPLVR